MKPKSKKILIASGLLVALGVAGYVAYKRAAPEETAPLFPFLTSTGETDRTQTQRASNYPEGTLLRQGSNDKVFVIDSRGFRHWISNRGYFDAHGYSMSNVRSISSQEMLSIPEASPLAGLLSGFTRS